MKEKSQRKTSDWFFYLFILLKDIFYYYIIILPPFGFQRGYNMTERSDFILTEINDVTIQMIGGNLFYFLIRRENDLSKWLKHVKRGYGK